MLNLQDRERLLAELGPLNQTVVLEGRRPPELSLPPDLVRIPTLLDGHRTLLGAEPGSLGRALAAGRLRSVPAGDRLGPAGGGAHPGHPRPGTVPDPSSGGPPRPATNTQAFPDQEIQAAQLPTTNLEHLSEALDQLGPEDEVDEPLPQGGFQPPAPQERALPIQQTAAGSTEFPEPPYLEPRATSRRPVILFLILLVALGLWAGLRWYKRNPIILPRLAQATRQNPEPAAPKPEPPAAEVPPKVEAKASPEPAPTVQAPPPVAPKPVAKPPAVPSKAERMKAIRDGNWKLALSQGAAQLAALQGKWSLRLEIACQGDTIQHAAGLLKDRDPDLFILPMTMRNGRTCYQVFLGSHESEAAAVAAAKRLPAPFLAAGNRPKPFRTDQIPSRQ